MHDVIRTVRIGQQYRFENPLTRDCRYGMALGGADVPIFALGCGRDGGFGAEGTSGVGFDLVALFVIGGDDGLEFGEVDF